MAGDVIPYADTLSALALAPGQELTPGAYQGIHFTVTCDAEWLLGKLEQWFADRDEVIFVDSGTTHKGMGFFVLEWESCQIDPLFIAILEHEEFLDDLSIYIRKEL